MLVYLPHSGTKKNNLYSSINKIDMLLHTNLSRKKEHGGCELDLWVGDGVLSCHHTRSLRKRILRIFPQKHEAIVMSVRGLKGLEEERIIIEFI
jgi:hypothetical protein